ncbi:MAG: EndoU domain-containing protein [Hyphomicrobiaceae bacterium]
MTVTTLRWAAVVAASAAVAMLGWSANAQEFFAAPRDFVVDKPCDGYRSFKRQTGASPLNVGQTYAGRGVNKRDGATHVFIRVGDESLWVALSCGRFADGGAAYPAGEGAMPRAAKRGQREAVCLPFFDDVDNPVAVGFGGTVDITPPAPTLDAFDDAIASMCGAPGKVTSAAEFNALLAAHPDVLARIKAFTGGKVFADRPAPADDAGYLSDLTEAWYAIKAFDHIMCGEPAATGSGKIGGLHFHGRYLRLQQSGQICRMDNLARSEVVPGAIYTMGVIMLMPDGRRVNDNRKGYGLTLSGEDLLKVVTRAFAENATASGESTGCLLPVADDGREFTTVFVRRATGIRTFYPDATPNARGDKMNPPCRAGISLQ